MKNLERNVEELVAQLCLNAEELAQRKAYLEITENDIALLRQARQVFETISEELADAFYRHLFEYPQLRALLPDEQTVARLRRSQAAYFLGLTGGDYGLDYVRERLRIGVVHQRIGLDPKWYIGAYRKYMSQLMPAVQRLLAADPEQAVPIYDALLKIICFDMGLALDTYFAAERQEIVRHKEYAEQVLERLPMGVIVVDAQLNLRSINAAMCHLLALGDYTVTPGATLRDLPAGEEFAERATWMLETGALAAHGVIIVADGAGGARHLEIGASKAYLGEQPFLLLAAKEVTERVKARAALRESEERFRLTFRFAGIGLTHVDPGGRLLRMNRKMEEILGYSEQEMLRQRFQDITHPDDVEADREIRRRIMADEIQTYAREKRYRHKDGRYIWVNINVSYVGGEGGGERYFIVAVEDISSRKEAAEQLVRLAKYDALTGLPNRVLLQDRLLQAISRAHRTSGRLAVLFIDLDRFKDINDSLGHQAGDRMLGEVSRRLSRQLRDSDTVARLGGDEFVVLLQDIEKEEQAAVVARKILAALAGPMVIQGMEFVPSGSIGISVYPKDGADGQTLLKNADTAMYRAKEKGKNNFQFYAQEMNERILDRLRIESGLRRALEHGEFALHYQPQVDTRSGRIIGVEALLRWSPPGEPAIPPARFIPIAEESELIFAIGHWVLREACTQSRRWADAGLPVRVTVNVSARQFRQDIEDAVSQALQETGCDPSGLVLELTESALMDNPEAAEKTLRALRDMGVRLAIDDFGTGYSSLNYLRRFPINALKIDRSFVCDISANPDGAAIVRAVIALARAMNMSVIAEGVETAEQARFLEDEQCRLMQGYFFGKPACASETEILLSAQAQLLAV